MSKPPGELEEYMAGSVRRDRAIQSEGERVQLVWSWCVLLGKQDEETCSTHGTNEDYICR